MKHEDYDGLYQFSPPLRVDDYLGEVFIRVVDRISQAG